MEYIMYSGKVRGQFKLVGNFSTFGKNAERSDVTWGQLAFDTETLGSLQRSNPKVSLLIQIVALLPMMTIIVAFLTRLGCFTMRTCSSASLIISGPKNCLSPVSDQFKGVRHRRPYRSSKGAMFRLD